MDQCTLSLIERLIYSIEIQMEKDSLKKTTDYDTTACEDLLKMLKILQIQAKVR